MIVVVLCWQQLVQTVQGEFWVRATQEGNQLATNVATVSEQQPLEIQKKEVKKKRKRTTLNQRSESFWSEGLFVGHFKGQGKQRAL